MWKMRDSWPQYYEVLNEILRDHSIFQQVGDFTRFHFKAVQLCVFFDFFVRVVSGLYPQGFRQVCLKLKAHLH